MSLLGIFERKKTFNLKDKAFRGLNMVDARATEWINIWSLNQPTPHMNIMFGDDWKRLPFQSICEILKIRFGKQFFNPEQDFDFYSFSKIEVFANSLSNAQKDFLKKHNFLPHKLFSKQEEKKYIEKEIAKCEIRIKEFNFNNETEREAIEIQEKKRLEDVLENLYGQIIKWQIENRDFDLRFPKASDFYDDAVELREWAERNASLLNEKTQFFQIATGQMIAANQAIVNNRGKAEFGHTDERWKLKSRKTPVPTPTKDLSGNAKPESDAQEAPKEAFEKAPEKKPVVQEEPEEAPKKKIKPMPELVSKEAPKPVGKKKRLKDQPEEKKYQSVSEILEERKKKQEGSYAEVREKLSAKKTNIEASISTTKKLAIASVVVLVLAAIYIFFF